MTQNDLHSEVRTSKVRLLDEIHVDLGKDYDLVDGSVINEHEAKEKFINIVLKRFPRARKIFNFKIGFMKHEEDYDPVEQEVTTFDYWHIYGRIYR